MESGEINPQYEVVREADMFGISGTERTTGDSVLVRRISKNRESVSELAAMLNKNKVSVLHAKDVIRDKLLAFLED